jgi:hypothetical protein
MNRQPLTLALFLLLVGFSVTLGSSAVWGAGGGSPKALGLAENPENLQDLLPFVPGAAVDEELFFAQKETKLSSRSGKSVKQTRASSQKQPQKRKVSPSQAKRAKTVVIP